jgi:WD40 repeat protein
MGRVEPALGWAWYAFAAKPDAETRSTALAALLRISPNLVGQLAVADALPQSLAWIDGKVLAYATSRGELELLDTSRGPATDKGSPPRRIAAPASDDATQAVTGLRMLANDRLLAVLRSGAIVEIGLANGGVRAIPVAKPAILNASPHAVSFSADADLIATAPTEEAPHLYRCRVTGDGLSSRCSEPLALGSERASAVEISPTGDRVAVGMRNGRVEVFPVTGSAPPATLPAGLQVVSLAWNPHHDLLAAGGEDGNIAVFDLGKHAELFRFRASGSIVSTIRWSPSGTELAFSCDSRIVCVARLPEQSTEAPAQIWRFEGHTNAVAQLAWSPDGAFLATADVEHEIIVWSLQPDRQVTFDLVSSGSAETTEIGSWPLGNRLASLRSDGGIGLWNTAPLAPNAERVPVEETSTLRTESREPVALAWRRDGALSVGYKDEVIACWQPDLNDPPRIIPVEWEPFQLSFSGTRALAAASADRGFYLMDPDCRDVGSVARLDSGDAPLPARAVEAEPTGRRVPVSYNDPRTKGATIAIWDVASRQIASWLPVTDPIAPLGLAISPDGRLLAATGGNSFLKLYDLDTPSKPPLLLPLSAEGTAGSVAFAPDGKLLAAAGADGSVYVWQVGVDSNELFLQVDPAGVNDTTSGQYVDSLAWLARSQLALLLRSGTIKILTLDPSFWRKRMEALHFPSPTPQPAKSQ